MAKKKWVELAGGVGVRGEGKGENGMMFSVLA